MMNDKTDIFALGKTSEIGVSRKGKDHGLTPVNERAVRTFYQSLVGLLPTITYSAFAQSGISITPSMKELLIQYCSQEPQFDEVIANIYTVAYSDMKRTMILD